MCLLLIELLYSAPRKTAVAPHCPWESRGYLLGMFKDFPDMSSTCQLPHFPIQSSWRLEREVQGLQGNFEHSPSREGGELSPGPMHWPTSPLPASVLAWLPHITLLLLSQLSLPQGPLWFQTIPAFLWTLSPEEWTRQPRAFRVNYRGTVWNKCQGIRPPTKPSSCLTLTLHPEGRRLQLFLLEMT